MIITKQQIENGRQLYSEFQRGMTGGFFTSLFEAIAKAKNENIYKLSQGFPGEVYAYDEYTGRLDPFAWDIEGETTKEKFARLTATEAPDASRDLRDIFNHKESVFHINGKPLTESELVALNVILESVLENVKDDKS